MKNKDTRVEYAFVIGRFQPFHNGHRYLIDFGLEHAKHVIIMVGGSNKSRSIKNPWTFEERKCMIEAAFNFADSSIIVEPLPDSPGNDDAWIGSIQSIITKYTDPKEAAVLGYKKDASSYYLDLFPDAKQLILEEGYATLSATNIRDAYFRDAPVFPQYLVPDPVLKYLVQYYETEEFKHVKEEATWLKEYKSMWSASPFPPQFVTADAVCTQMGHVLLVTRGGFPGKGLLALPGGFVDAHKGDSYENILHELWEEANIHDSYGRIPRGKLNGFFTGEEKRFDDPNRSIRGFTLTTAFRFKFPDAKKLFDVSGGDDALDARWYQIGYIKNNPELIFEDHYHIMSEMDVW